MESFICKTNNAEEIKHSGELSGPFKNQYEAFHLRPNLFLVIILHILCPPLCLLTHKHIMCHTHAHEHTHTHSSMLSHAHRLNLTQTYRHNKNTGLQKSLFNRSFCNYKPFINHWLHSIQLPCTVQYIQWESRVREQASSVQSDALIRIKVLSVTEWRALEQNHP